MYQLIDSAGVRHIAQDREYPTCTQCGLADCGPWIGAIDIEGSMFCYYCWKNYHG